MERKDRNFMNQGMYYKLLAALLAFAIAISFSCTQVSAADPYSTMIALKSAYPEGMEFTDEKNSYDGKGRILNNGHMIGYKGTGCQAFALILSDAIYGDMPYLVHKDFSKLKVGDALRLQDDNHTVVILEINGDELTVAEGNYNNSVHWGRKLKRSDSVQDGWSYIITRGQEDVQKIKFNLEDTVFPYTGKPWTPDVDSLGLIEGKDFIVSYDNNVAVGTATATITGKGNYTGHKVLEFKIAEDAPSGKIIYKELYYNGSPQSLLSVVGLDNYDMLYALTPDDKEPSESAFNSSIPTGTDAGQYHVWYKGKYVEGNHVTEIELGHGTSTILEKPIDSSQISLSQQSYVYDGKEKKPSVIVRDGDKIIPESEYTVAYKNNTNAGSATVMVHDNEGGNYDVNGARTFNITAPVKKKPKAKGTKITDSKTKGQYLVTSKASASKPTVSYIGSTSPRQKTWTVPAQINADGVNYIVNEIGSKAIKNKWVRQVNIGKNVVRMDNEAIYNCSNLTELTLPANTYILDEKFVSKCSKLGKFKIKTRKLTKKSVKDNAFSGLKMKTTVKVPKVKVNTYTPLLRDKGLNKKIKINGY